MMRVSEMQDEAERIESDSKSSFYGLLPAFRRLDRRLKMFVDAADSSETEGAAHYPGLLISRPEVNRLLERKPGESAFKVDAVLFDGPLFDLADNANPHLQWLARAYQLTSFELDIILIALATELDLRYERIFAYLQDDITCKRPSVELALDLLSPSIEDKQSRRACFAPQSPLIGNNLLQLAPDADRSRSLLACQLRLEEGVVNLLLGSKALDVKLAPFCQAIEPVITLQDVPISNDLKRALQTLVAREGGQSLRLFFHGARGSGKRQAAEALAARTGSAMLIVDTEHAFASAADFAPTLKLILREARFHNALLYFEHFDTMLDEGLELSYRLFLKALSESASPFIVASEKPPAQSFLHPLKISEVHFSVQGFRERRACWEENLRGRGVRLNAADLDALASSFRLPCGEIVAAITSAVEASSLRVSAAQTSSESTSTTSGGPTATDMFAAARARLNHKLSQFARRIEPKYDWADIVLPPDQISQLREICARHKHQQVVYGEWGFDRKLSSGKGLSALFSGHPGTGKTMAAEVLAGELGLELYKIDLSQVVSKYIGETEKSLSRIFREAQDGSSILFFDEADALFGKRTEVKDAHDRYANIEVSYLLQKMEEHDGIAILATNLRQNMDDAFLRRIQFIVEFPFPDEEHRRRIWEVVFPKDAPVASDVDFQLLARTARLAGGNIKNIGLAAAFYAAADGRVIRHEHLVRAARREFQKLGRTWNEKDWKVEEKPERSRSAFVEVVLEDD